MITLAANGAAPANPRRWQEAVDHHAARTPVSRSTWDAMEAQARQRAFTVSGITSTQLLTDVHGAIDQAIANGTTLRDFKQQMEARLTAEWGAPNAARVETIFRTNVQTAYNAGRHAQMSTPTAMALRPYWAFQAILDKRTSPTCAPLDKVTRPVGDEFWDSHWPPLHFNCRSTVTSLSRREFDRVAASPAGVKTEAVHADGRPVKPPLPGFGAAPDLAGTELRPPRTTPPDVQRAFDARQQRTIGVPERRRSEDRKDNDPATEASAPQDWNARSDEVRQRATAAAEMDEFLQRHPLRAFEVRPNFDDLDEEDRGANGVYLPGRATVLINNARPLSSFGEHIDRAWSVSSAAATADEAVVRTAVHELGHHVREQIGGPLRELLTETYDAAVAAERTLTDYASTHEEEYFSECFSAYVHHPQQLYERDRDGYSLIQLVREKVGLSVHATPH